MKTTDTDDSFRGCSRRTVLKTAAGGAVATSLAGITPGVAVADGGDERWRFDADELINAAPTVVDETVYIATADTGMGSHVFALDADPDWSEGEPDSDEIWAFEASGDLRTPTVLDGSVYVGGSSSILSISTDDGSQEWEADYGTSHAVTVVDGMVYVGGEDALYALSAEEGELEWEYEVDAADTTAPTVYDGLVLVGTDGFMDETGGVVYALDADEGTLEWEFETDYEDMTASPTVADETVFLSGADSFDGTVYAVSLADGDLEWETHLDDNPRTTPTVYDDYLYTVGGSSIYALSTSDGSIEWEFNSGDDGGNFASAPTYAGGTVFAGHGSQERFYAIDADSGNELWSFETGENNDSSPTVVDGTVYFGSGVGTSGTFYALDAGVDGSSEGSRVRQATLGHHDSFTGAMPGTAAADAGGESNGASDGDADDDGPGFGVGAGIAGLGGAAYLLKRKLTTDSRSTE